MWKPQPLAMIPMFSVAIAIMNGYWNHSWQQQQQHKKMPLSSVWTSVIPWTHFWAKFMNVYRESSVICTNQCPLFLKSQRVLWLKIFYHFCDNPFHYCDDYLKVINWSIINATLFTYYLGLLPCVGWSLPMPHRLYFPTTCFNIFLSVQNTRYKEQWK